MNGVLVVDKPQGPTSHDIVAKVRKVLREKKVGHTGTLDPAATGVLPLVLGKATKVARYLSGSDKRYTATVLLGSTTNTLDADGEVLETKPVNVSEAEVKAALEQFRGDIKQMPPMYSAKKIDGKRLYQLARKGVDIERPEKDVTIRTLELLGCELPEVHLDVLCSPGTYVRVLADDLGKVLGCGAHLKALRRTEVGPFTLEDAVTLDALVENPELAEKHLIPMSRALEGLPRIDIPSDIARMVTSGYQMNVADLRTLDTPEFAADEALTLGIRGEAPVAIVRSLIPSAALPTMRRDEHALKTERVLG